MLVSADTISVSMPNRYQLAFVASTLLSFFTLLFLSRAALSLLARAGYDPANIILIGLPSTPSQPTMAFPDLSHVLTSPLFAALAVVIAGALYYMSQSSA